jgi:hypothetical protein
LRTRARPALRSPSELSAKSPRFCRAPACADVSGMCVVCS